MDEPSTNDLRNHLVTRIEQAKSDLNRMKERLDDLESVLTSMNALAQRRTQLELMNDAQEDRNVMLQAGQCISRLAKIVFAKEARAARRKMNQAKKKEARERLEEFA